MKDKQSSSSLTNFSLIISIFRIGIYEAVKGKFLDADSLSMLNPYMVIFFIDYFFIDLFYFNLSYDGYTCVFSLT